MNKSSLLLCSPACQEHPRTQQRESGVKDTLGLPLLIPGYFYTYTPMGIH